MSGSDPDLVLEILRGIRAAAERTNAQLDVLTQRVDRLSERVDDGFDHAEKKYSVIEHTLVDAGAQLLFLNRYLRNKTEGELEDLKLRVAKLEAKVG